MGLSSSLQEDEMVGSDNDLSNTYTDSPHLHPNLILGSLQLLIWLFFHPTAWHNYLARIDPLLHPNFDLGNVSRSQWRNSELRLLLLRVYVVLPLCMSLLVGFLLLILGRPPFYILFGAGVTLMLGFGAGVVGGLVLGVAASVVGVFCIGLSGGFAVGIGLDPATNLRSESILVHSVFFGLIYGMGGGIFGHVISTVTGRKETYSSTRQLLAVVFGSLIGMVALFFAGFTVIEMGANFQLGLIASVVTGGVMGWRRGPLVGLVAGLLTLIAIGLIINYFDEVTFEIVVYMAFITLPYFIAESIAGAWRGVIAGVLGSLAWIATFIIATGVPFLSTLTLGILSVFIGLTLPLWGYAVAYPAVMMWNIWLRWADKHRSPDKQFLFHWHSAFCDEHQRFPLLGLDEHLLWVMERNPIEGQAALEYLSTSRQRWAARAVQIELDARLLEDSSDVSAIGKAYCNSAAGELEGPASALLRSFKRISQDVDAALSQTSAYNQRLALSAVEDRLDSLIRELTRSNERYTVRFRPIATNWRQVIAQCTQEMAETVELRQEIDNPYVIGVPLTEQQEIFVGRTEVSTRIEHLLLDRRRPPLLLYGQRRMGKTSLLNNLGRLLPSTIVPLFIDLQGPASQVSDHTGFFYNIARGMINTARRQRNLTFPPLPRETLAPDPFTYFDEWLDDVEQVLGNQTALVTLDEFEALDHAIAKGNLDGKALLNMMRHIIQHRARFKILLTSSHALEAFKRWSSYLINIQVVHISYLNQAEARQLIEYPVQDFALRYEPEASQRVLSLTQGHPFLVQLLCSEIVALKNEQDPSVRRLARLADVEVAVSEALKRGSFFFADIETNQIDGDGLILLQFLAGLGEEAVISREMLHDQLEDSNQVDRTLTSLTDRELIEETDGGFRFQVELIRRWFMNVQV